MCALKQQLLADGEYFKRMLNMVPGSFLKLDNGTAETVSNTPTGGEMLLRFDKCDSLRHSLQNKIESLKSKRVKPGTALDSAEKKRLKRKLSKAKLRQRQKAAKQQTKDHAAGTTVKTEIASKQTFNKDGKLVFSKFEFAENSSKKHRPNKNTDIPSGKNYKALLTQAKKKKEKVSEAEFINKERAKEMSKKEIWKSALLKAEGVKLKDNPELLQKAIKRREQKKKSSERQWVEREKTVAKQIKDRQDKRSRNIAKKKEGRANKKIQKAKKRGRVAVN